jgi:adenine-specific DNA-methyltransferase
MTAEVMRLAVREAPPESIRTLIRTTISAIERSFNTIDRLQPRTRLALALSLLENGTPKTKRFERPTAALATELAKLSVDDRHYWISTFFTLLMSVSLRREKATYFTPPPVVRYLIKQAEKAGLDLKTARVIDPAAGGAAFVSSLAGRMTELGCCVEDIRRRIAGIEIDRHLAVLGEALLCDRLGEKYADDNAGRLIQIGDSLAVDEAASYDAVFVNPPYGRILGLPGAVPPDWLAFSAPGHINKYALFMDLAFRMAKPGGLVATVSPSSFVSGPLFERLRQSIRTRAEVVRIDVLERKDVFHDVQQDACISIFRMRSGAPQAAKTFAPEFGRIDRNWRHTEVGVVTTANEGLTAPWVLPNQGGHDDGALQRCTARLGDYGVSPKAGYFVWNRKRWLRGSTKEAIVADVGRHFFAGAWTAVRDDHAVARLWWNAYVASLAMPADPERALRIMLSKADIRSNLVERSGTSSRPMLAAAIIRAMISDPRIAETEDGFRVFMRTVNKLGGGELFEVMPSAEVDRFVRACADRAREAIA